MLAVSGCAFVKPGSLAVSQPQGIGSVRVHFILCTSAAKRESAGRTKKPKRLQYLLGIAVPPGSVPPASFTAMPIGGGAPIVFTRNEEVAPEIAASSGSLQKIIGEFKPETRKKTKKSKHSNRLFGGPWPPSGLQGFGYLSAPVQEVKGETAEWSVDADFGLPTAADGGPFPGPSQPPSPWVSAIVAGETGDSGPSTA